MARSRKSFSAFSGNGILYCMAFILFFSGWLMVMTGKFALAPAITLPDIVPPLFMAASFLVVWLIIWLSGFRGDQFIPLLTLLLAGIGLLVQFRLGVFDFGDAPRASAYAYPLGVFAFLFTWLLFRAGRHSWLSGLAVPCLLAACALLGGILLFGTRFRGAIFLAGQLNPAELVKLLLAVFLAWVMTEYRKPLQQTVAGIPAPPIRPLLTLALLWVLPMGLLIAQRDLGMIILLNLVLLVLVFMATGRWGYLAVGGAIAALAGYAGFQLFAHARLRFIAWQNPFSDPTGSGWQILQSLSAMFSGGMWGSGLGAGAPSIVPIAASDFVYAAIAEELGFVGCVFLAMLYLSLFYRGYRVADQQRNLFAQTLAAAITTMLALQVLMNIGGVTKAIPLTGITLPLISHGGSSLVTSFAMLGLLTALSEPASGRGRK